MVKMWMIWPSHALLKTKKIIVYNGKSNAANLGLDKTKQIPQKPRVISHAREEWTSPVPSWSANSKSYLWLQGLYWKYWAVYAILSIFYIDKIGVTYSFFLPEKWVYTSFPPGKISIYSFFPPERSVYTHLSPWFLGGNLSIYWSFPLILNPPPLHW